MSSGGGKSGSDVKESTLPDWLQQPVQRNLQRAEDLMQVPFRPYMGAEIAAFDPNQEAAFDTNLRAAEAFGFSTPKDAMSGMPKAQTFADGTRGYSSMSLFDEAMNLGKERDPEAYEAYDSLFGNYSNNVNTGLPTGNPSGGGGGGGGNYDAIDPNDAAIQKLRDARAREQQRQGTAKATQSYLDDSQMSFSDPRKSPGHPSNQNYNYTPIVNEPYSNPLLDQKGATPTVPYNNPRLNSSGYTPTNASTGMSLDEIVAGYKSGK